MIFSRSKYLESHRDTEPALAAYNQWPVRCDGLPVIDGYVNDPAGGRHLVFPEWICDA